MRRTDKYEMPYLEEGDLTLPTIETQRWETLDAQLFSLFRILGNGVITGWDLTAGDGLSVVISAGRGHVNYVAVESQQSTVIVTLTANTRNYIYAGLTTSSFWLQSVVFKSLLSSNNTNRLVYLGYVDTDATSVTAISTDGRNDVGYIGEIRDLISQHVHIGGTEDPEPINLATEVQDELNANNMQALDAARITQGQLDLDRIPQLDHITKLINNGILTHAQLDSFVTSLSANNVSLMGSVTSANYLKLVLHLMHTDPTVDGDLLNERTIIAGITPASYIDFVNTDAGITYNTVEGTISASPTGTPMRLFTDAFSVNNALKSFILTYEDEIRIGPYTESTSSVDSNSSDKSESSGDWSVTFAVSAQDSVDVDDYIYVDAHTISDVSSLVSDGNIKVMVEFNGDDGTLITLGGFAFMFSSEGSPFILS
jgi:hypothetical protein